jgi:beta-fructofuranosidase
MFFQHNPAVPPRQRDMVWGHCSSTDLVNWDLHGIALAPSDEHPGVEEFWSGNTIEQEGLLVAFYSAQADSDRYQLPRMTVSVDSGHSFGGDRATIPRPNEEEHLEHLRDPFVWRDSDGWRMLIGSGNADGTAGILLYESANLLSWTRVGTFVARSDWPEASEDLGSCWECPQYAWELGLLLIGAWRPEAGQPSVYALKGAEEDGSFTIHDVERVDHGTDFYAPSLMRTEDSRYLLWGWIWEARDRAWRDQAGWEGMLSLPREVSLESGSLVIRPARELDALRGRLCYEQSVGSGGIYLGEVPRAFELLLRLKDLHDSVVVVLELGGGQRFSISLDSKSGLVRVDRERASTDARAYGGTTTIESRHGLVVGGTVELRWFVDHSVSELFLSEGAVATTRLYPVSDSPWTLRVEAPGATRVEARVWEIRATVRQTPKSARQ